MLKSLLDNDLYKFTMQQAVLHHFPGAIVEYKFFCRTPNVDFTNAYNQIVLGIKALDTLSFSNSELIYLSTFNFFKNDYIDFLRIFKLNSSYVTTNLSNGQLEVIVRGPWLHTILYEVPLLAIISESYFSSLYPSKLAMVAKKSLGLHRLMHEIKKISSLKDGGFKFADFGTRRRFSHDIQDKVIVHCTNNLPKNFIGTSNLYFAKKHNIKAIGTMAHEWLQASQAVGPRLRDSQKFALDTWVQEYRGDLGIALSDVINMDAFLNDFDLFFCKLFDGVRHDSGDPIIWGEKLLSHYKYMGINPLNKTAIFSDGLNFDKAISIYKYFKGRINTSFGIGTFLTNNISTNTKLSIVMKMVRCNNQPVAKISDAPSKMMCDDQNYLNYLTSVFKEQL